MTVALPAQEFQIGQRVQPNDGDTPFVIHYIKLIDERIAYNMYGRPWYFANKLTLAPERPPYVPSERLVVGRRVTIARYQPELYRCETDTELAARHAVERAEYDQQDATDAVIYNASGQPIGITGRTGQPGPGAA